MIRLAGILLLIFTVIACDKNGTKIPQSLIDVYDNVCGTDIGCYPEITAVKLDGQTFYAVGNQLPCEPGTSKVFHYPNGKLVEEGSTDYVNLVANGEYQEVVWQCPE